jgi:hypothetical protein
MTTTLDPPEMSADTAFQPDTQGDWIDWTQFGDRWIAERPMPMGIGRMKVYPRIQEITPGQNDRDVVFVWEATMEMGGGQIFYGRTGWSPGDTLSKQRAETGLLSALSDMFLDLLMKQQNRPETHRIIYQGGV